MEFKGTKGDWIIQESLGMHVICDELSKNDLIDEQHFHREAKANAQLMVNAPKLLEALKGFVRDFETDYVLNGKIVDNPRTMLVSNYDIFKQLIEQATKID